MSAHLCTSDVSLDVADHLLAGLNEQPHAEHVAHRPAHTEQAGLMPEKLCNALLELVDRWVLRIHVVADRRGQHGRPHLFGWLSHGVRAQINHGHESDEVRRLLCVGVSTCSASVEEDTANERGLREQRINQNVSGTYAWTGFVLLMPPL